MWKVPCNPSVNTHLVQIQLNHNYPIPNNSCSLHYPKLLHVPPLLHKQYKLIYLHFNNIWTTLLSKLFVCLARTRKRNGCLSNKKHGCLMWYQMAGEIMQKLQVISGEIQATQQNRFRKILHISSKYSNKWNLHWSFCWNQYPGNIFFWNNFWAVFQLLVSCFHRA